MKRSGPEGNEMGWSVVLWREKKLGKVECSGVEGNEMEWSGVEWREMKYCGVQLRKMK